MLLDPEWVNLDGFAVLGGTPVSNSSAGKPDLMTLLTRTSWNRICNLRDLLMGLKPFSTACRKQVLSSWIYCNRKPLGWHFFVLLRSSLVKWILILAKITFFLHIMTLLLFSWTRFIPKWFMPDFKYNIFHFVLIYAHCHGGIWIFKHMSCKRSLVNNGARKNRHKDTCVQTVPKGLLNLCTTWLGTSLGRGREHSDTVKKRTRHAVGSRTSEVWDDNTNQQPTRLLWSSICIYLRQSWTGDKANPICQVKPQKREPYTTGWRY